MSRQPDHSVSWRKWQHSLDPIVGSLIVWVIFILFLAPYLYLIVWSFKRPGDIQAYPPRFFSPLTLENYKQVFTDVNIAFYLKNSALVATVTTVLSLLLAIPAAYSFSRFVFWGKEGLAYLFIAIMVAPLIALVYPFLVLANQLGLRDSHLGLVLFYLPWNVPFAVWMLRTFVSDVPQELEDSAQVDGCTLIGAFARITAPLLLPGFFTTGVFIFIGAWNEFVIAFFLTSTKARTLPTTIDFFLTYGSFQFAPMFAAGVVSTLPIALCGLLVRRYYLAGTTAGALTG
jgi:multiple sugar transport system permease protein